MGFPRFVPSFHGEADAFITDTLEPIANGLDLIVNGQALQAQFGADAARAVRSLNRIDNKDWLPPALLRFWKRKLDDKDAVSKFLIELERLAYFLFVTRADVNERIIRFASVMDQIDPRPGKSAPGGGLALTPDEQSEFLSDLSGPLYTKSRVCKPVLQRLDEELSSGGAIYEDPTSIEHVLPQKVDEEGEWAKLFPDLEVRAAWTHRLANLVFLTKRINTRASNWDFDRKKREYFASTDGASPFPLTQAVLQTAQWTPDHLEQRQQKLLAALSGIWRLEMSAPSETQT